MNGICLLSFPHINWGQHSPLLKRRFSNYPPGSKHKGNNYDYNQTSKARSRKTIHLFGFLEVDDSHKRRGDFKTDLPHTCKEVSEELKDRATYYTQDENETDRQGIIGMKLNTERMTRIAKTEIWSKEKDKWQRLTKWIEWRQWEWHYPESSGLHEQFSVIWNQSNWIIFRDPQPFHLNFTQRITVNKCWETRKWTFKLLGMLVYADSSSSATTTGLLRNGLTGKSIFKVRRRYEGAMLRENQMKTYKGRSAETSARRVCQAPPPIKSYSCISTLKGLDRRSPRVPFHNVTFRKQSGPFNPILEAPSRRPGSFTISPFHIITRRSPLFDISKWLTVCFPWTFYPPHLRCSLYSINTRSFSPVEYSTFIWIISQSH